MNRILALFVCLLIVTGAPGGIFSPTVHRMDTGVGTPMFCETLTAGDTVALYDPNAACVLGQGGIDCPALPIGTGLADGMLPGGTLILTAATRAGGVVLLSGEASLSCGYGAGLFLINGEKTAWTPVERENGLLLQCVCAGTTYAICSENGVFTVRPYEAERETDFLLRAIRVEAGGHIEPDRRAVTLANLPEDSRSQAIVTTGVLTARYGDYGTLHSAVLTDGSYAIEVYDPLLTDSDGVPLHIGDRVAIAAKLSRMGEMPYLDEPIRIRAVTRESVQLPVYDNLSELRSDAARLKGAAVRLRGVVVAEQRSDGQTILKDARGNTLPLYRAPKDAGGTDWIVVVEFQGDTLQLRCGSIAADGETGAPTVRLFSSDTLSAGKDAQVRIGIDSQSPILSVRADLYKDGTLLTTLVLFPEQDAYAATLPASMLQTGALTLRVHCTVSARPMLAYDRTWELIVQ